MDSQLEAVRQDIGSVKDEVVKTKQDLAAAKEARNWEQERLFFQLLLSLNNRLSGLQEKENIILRSQAPSPLAKRQNLAMSFKHVGALDVRVNFLVRPAAFEELVRWVVRGLIVMVIGHRQAGKSTIVVLLDHYISQKQVNVGNTVLESIGICLNKNTPMDPAGFLHWFHTVLRIQRPDVICAPRPLSAGPQALANVQEDLLQALRLDAENPHAFAIFVDEAGYMAAAHVSKQDRQQASKAVSCFLELLRAEFRDRKHLYMVYSIVLFGVDSLKRLLHDVNMVDDSSIDTQQTPNASAVAKDMSSLQHSDGSDDSKKWGNLSPFSEDFLISLQPMTQDQIAYLLQQYTEHRRESDLGFNLDVCGLAECIFERTEGFPGLVGLCCSEVDSKTILSVEDWVRWCGVNLVTRVQQQRNFSVLSATTGLLAMSTRNQRLRQVMQMLLLQGSCMLERAERRTVAESLLSEGVARISSKTPDKIKVEMTCPLLRDVLLMEARFGLHICPVPARTDTLDMQWILRESVARIQPENIQAEAAQTACKPFSEYVWQGELFSIIKAVVKTAYPLLLYRMVSEGRNLRSVQHGRKRVDLVLIDSGVLPAHVVELLVSGSKEEMHEHWRRAVDVYQKLYTYGKVPCTIQVVNICLKGKEGTGYKWLPKVASPYVHVVHIQLHGDYSGALVTWESGVEEMVAILGGHGHLEFFPGPID